MTPMTKCPSCQRWNKHDVAKCWKCGAAMELPDPWVRTFVVASDFLKLADFIGSAFGNRHLVRQDMVLAGNLVVGVRHRDGNLCYTVTLTYRRIMPFGKITPEPFPIGPSIPDDWKEVHENAATDRR